MSRDILVIVKAMAHEKDVNSDTIFAVIEEALALASKENYGKDLDISVIIDKKTGDYATFKRLHVVADDDLTDPETQIALTVAKERDATAKVGAVLLESIPSIEFGRIETQKARQFIVQRVREIERAHAVNSYRDKIGSLITGNVKLVNREKVLIELPGGAEVTLLRSQMLPRESYRINDRIRVVLQEIKESPNAAPQLMISRICNEMLIELFRIEVPEIAEGVIEIMAAARDPGTRAKIAVKTNDGRIDPIGACVGMRGARVQAVSSELGGERVDIVLYDDEPVQFVINAMAPADVASIVMDEDAHTMTVAVQAAQLSQAIGRNGQNIRLAGTLTGWELNVVTEEQALDNSQQEKQKLMQMFVAALDIDETVAEILVDEGFTSVEELVYVPQEEMLQIAGFDDALVDELRDRAKDNLLTTALSSESNAKQPAADLLAVAGITPELASVFAQHGIITKEDLADSSVYDLLEIKGMTEEQAAKLIMEARKDWFTDE